MSSLKIGKKLQLLRKSMNYTTTELAEKVNVSQAYISQIENDKAVPNIDMLDRLLKALETDMATFFSHGRPNDPDDLVILFENLRKLHPDVRYKIIELLEVINK